MKIGIDLLWVKPGKSGGTESYIRNLLDGLVDYGHDYQFILFTAADNAQSFMHYDDYNMVIKKCKVKSALPLKRYFWENLHLDIYARHENIDVMFIPVYSKPFSYRSKIPYVCCIADLQALHYPQFFSKMMNIFMRFIWWYTCKTSDKIVTISDDVKKDIEKNYPISKGKVETLYLPVISNDSAIDFDKIERKYGIKKEEYFYCVSSLLPHKNLSTILKVIAKLKQKGKLTPLVISGVGGQIQEFNDMCEKLHITDCVIQTGFVSNSERDCLYEHCKIFLFPSIFEGFGMPPIEAMRKGRHVITTKKSCLYEITEGKAIYVNDPFDVDEWIKKIELAEKTQSKRYDFNKYNLKEITENYLRVLVEEGNKKK